MLTEENPNQTEEAQNNQSSPPSISLPKGGGAIRGIGEKFAANPVTGNGSLSVPIAASPGRSGFGPQLSLTYDSGAGNGPFGFGWNLSLPSITRKTDKGLPKYQDGDEIDTFILSGAEDLVPVLKKQGNDWVPEEVPDRTIGTDTYQIKCYRPRIEGLFARIERWTNQSDPTDVSWRSISRDNITTWYGKNAESRIADPTNLSRIFSWLICESYDDKGNVIVYEYAAENSQRILEDRHGNPISLVHEHNRDDKSRSANRYLKYIRYGNHTPYFPELLPDQPWPQPHEGWFFEVVFDYGEHDEVAPKPNDDNSRDWPCRPDPFSSYRSGFEVRTYRLCQRVLMFHHIPDISTDEKGYDGLVRSTDFTYSHEQNPQSARNPVYTFLREVTQCGYKRDGDGYLKRNLPPVEFDYTEPIVQETVADVDPESLENLPVGVDGSTYQWTDLHGEGIPGILTEQADGWFFKRNLSPIAREPDKRGPVEFGPLEQVALKPNLSVNEGAQFMDLAGDGQPDLVVLDGSTTGLYEHDDKEGWQPFRPFTSRLNRNTQDPNLKFVDLDGDGHADVLITEDDAFVWHTSLAEEGFGPAQRVQQALDEEKGPRLVFADGTQSIHLADLSGDGLSDLVRIRNGEVCYWPNLGYCRFGAKVTMDNAPWFDASDQFDHKRIRLADIDGSGTTDIVYLHRDGVRLYFNQSGNSWSRAQVLKVFPRVDDLVNIAVTDLLGNGTACLVWSSPLPGHGQKPMRYISLMGEQKPHLLVATRNNLGAETKVRYAPSIKFYLQDKQSGNPWITRLPFPVHVVERVETFDRISRNRFVTRYTYHHGYFDGEEREFRGFGMVEQWDTEEFATIAGNDDFLASTNFDESSHMPPVRTKTWFHTGAYLGRAKIALLFAHEYYGAPSPNDPDFDNKLITFVTEELLPDTILEGELSIEEEREACRALKGSMLRQEVYALDGTDKEPYPYTVTEQNFTIQCLQPHNNNRHAVFFTHPREAINYHYERNPDDPRVAHAMTLEVDKFGNMLKDIAIGYGRPKGLSPLEGDDKQKQEQMLITYTENDYTKDEDNQPLTDLVTYPDDYRTPLPCEVRTYELTGFELEANTSRFSFEFFEDNDFEVLRTLSTIGYHETPDISSKQKRLIEHVRTLYRANNLSGPLPMGEYQSLALPYENHKLALTPEQVSQVYQRTVDGQPPENLLPNPANVLGSQGPDQGGYVDLDGDGHWWIPSGQVFYSPDESDTPAAELDYAREHFFTPHRYQDPFGHSATVAFDYDLLVRETRDALENTSSAVNDFRVLQPKQMTGPNGNRTAVAFDTLGMVVATAVMGKEGETNPEKSGDTLEDPTTRLEYELFAWRDHEQPNFVHTYAREQHGAANPRWQESYLYSDGFGRELQTKVQAEPGDASQRDPATAAPYKPGKLIKDADNQPVLAHTEQRWVGTGRTIYNNKGKPVKQYEPFFSSTPLYEDETELVETGVTPTLFYDPVGRVVATLHPNHTYEKVVFDPWRQEIWDVNDTVAISKPWDDEQEEHISGYFTRLLNGDTANYKSWHDQRKDEQLGKAEKEAAIKAAKHADTPSVAHLDSLGRTFLTIADNGLDSEGNERKYATRVELDIEGNQRAVEDARGRIVMAYDYDMRGNRITQDSMDAGVRWTLNDVTGNPIRAWDSRGHTFRNEYDVLRRPKGSFVKGADATDPNREILFERTVYGEAHPDSVSATSKLNLRGQVYMQLDGAGVVYNAALNPVTNEEEGYDFKGNPLRGTRQLYSDYKALVDWATVEPLLAVELPEELDVEEIRNALNPLLEPEKSSASTRYDALNRAIQVVAPHSNQPGANINVTQPTYNEANLLECVDTWLAQSTEPQALLNPTTADIHTVENIDYDAKGQRTRIDYGNAVCTEYSYDKETFRLIHLNTKRSGFPANKQIVQDLHYAYDPAGNITSIRDHAQQTVIFDNIEIQPHCDYSYDAIYRLIQGKGREHAVQNNIQRDYNDFKPITGIPFPNSPEALQKYTEDYKYDEVGNILSLSHRGDGSQRWKRCYQYALDSNRLLGTSGADEFNAQRCSDHYVSTPLSPLPQRYDYDGHGNMTKMPHLPVMEWDFEDQLRVSAKQVATDPNAVEKTYYVYDASGERVRRVTELATGALKDERLYLGGFEIYRQYNGDGSSIKLERETLHITDDTQRIAMVETKTIDTNNDPSPTRLIRYQFGNHLGSASLELDNGAQIISYEEYYPYGSTSYQAVRNQTDTPKRYRYTGKERDEETGLYYHGARYYAPWLGRWTAADPAGLVDGVGLYIYVRNNPLTYADVNGKWLTRQRVSRQARQSGYSLSQIGPPAAAPAPQGLDYVEAAGKRQGLQSDRHRTKAHELAEDMARHPEKYPYQGPEMFALTPEESDQSNTFMRQRRLAEKKSEKNIRGSPVWECATPDVVDCEKIGYFDPGIGTSDVEVYLALGGLGKALSVGGRALSNLLRVEFQLEGSLGLEGLGKSTNAFDSKLLTGQVEYGSTDLSKMAIDYAKKEKIVGARNIAVFEYTDLDGTVRTIARASQRGKGHAEKLVSEELRELGIPNENVTRIYSELAPCSAPGGYCKGMIEQGSKKSNLGPFKNAKVTYSIEYGGTPHDPTKAAKGVEELRGLR